MFRFAVNVMRVVRPSMQVIGRGQIHAMLMIDLIGMGIRPGHPDERQNKE